MNTKKISKEQDKKARQAKKARIDTFLAVLILAISSFGLIMVLSASSFFGEYRFNDKYYFFTKQSTFFAISLVLFFITIKLPKNLFYKPVYLWLTLTLLLFILTLFTPLGLTAGGATRWLNLGFFSFQPLEIAKITLVFYLAYFLSSHQEKIKKFSVGVIPPFVVTSLLSLFLLLQPDFGGAVFLGLILFLMCLVGGTRFIYLVIAGACASFGGWYLIVSSAYRYKRWLAFLDPFASTDGYQLKQSYLAFGSGQFTGAGLGASKQKLLFLPEAHNDFIMAIVGEELGFLWLTPIFLVLFKIIWRGFRIAAHLQDLRDCLTAFGMTLILGLGSTLNLAVALGAIPTKGVPMPFISYGGSSLLTSFFAAGVLLNLSRYAVYPEEPKWRTPV